MDRHARAYTIVFPLQTSRFINWELYLVHSPQPERIDFEIDAVFYRPDGTEVSRQTAESYVDAGSTRSDHESGIGWHEPGKWKPGLYRMDLYIEGQFVADGNFEIVDNVFPNTGSFADLRRDWDWARSPLKLDEEAALMALSGLIETDRDLASSAVGLPWVQSDPAEEGLWTLQALEVLAIADIDLAKQVLAMPWIADEVSRDEWLTLRTLALWATADAMLAARVAEFEWLNNGITGDESSAVSILRDISIEDPSLFQTLLSLPWLHDHLTENERRVIVNLIWLAKENPKVAQQIAEMSLIDGPIETLHGAATWGIWKLSDTDSSLVATLGTREWFSDGLSENEARLLSDLGFIASKSPGAASAIGRMPFLNTFEPADTLATTALLRLVRLREDDDEESEEASEQFERLMVHPAIKDGITDEETRIVATIFEVSKYKPELVNVLLNPAKVILEERTITLPLAGEGRLTIILTRPGPSRTMDLIEDATVFIEKFMGVPFPQPHFIYLFEYATPPSATGTFGAVNYGTNIAIRPDYFDSDESSSPWVQAVLAHESGHFFWRGFPDWIDEGAASFLESAATNVMTGEPIAPQRMPCKYFESIKALEDLEPGLIGPEFGCNYSLGERIFHDLYRNMDDTTFRLGFRRLYLLSKSDDPDDGCEGTQLSICHVGAAFTTDVSHDTAVTVRKVIARWYDGSEPFDHSFRDDDPVDPEIPWINGRILRAYLSITAEGFEVTNMSGGEDDASLYLNLQYSHGGVPSQDSLPLRIVTYFEGDGFPFGNTTAELPLPSNERRRIESLYLDNAPATGRPGNYRVYAYWGDQKIAEATYEVDPELETTNIRGVVTGPDGEPLEGIGLWAWQGKRDNSGYGRTGEDGKFDIRVLKGSYTLDLYTGEECGFVGWYNGVGGMTTIRGEASKVEVKAVSVEGVEIRLPDRPEDLPLIEHCS